MQLAFAHAHQVEKIRRVLPPSPSPKTSSSTMLIAASAADSAGGRGERRSKIDASSTLTSSSTRRIRGFRQQVFAYYNSYLSIDKIKLTEYM
jgi:hypothetical protein